MNLDYFTKDIGQIPEYLIGALLLYLMVLLFINLVGLKSFSKMSSYDFAHTIAIGSLIASSVSSGSPSLLVGIFLIALLFAIKFVISFAQKKSSTIEDLVNNQPILLMEKGKILDANLKKTRMTESELYSKLREANVLQMSQVMAVVLETTGDVSVLHSEEDMEIDECILEGVGR